MNDITGAALAEIDSFDTAGNWSDIVQDHWHTSMIACEV